MSSKLISKIEADQSIFLDLKSAQVLQDDPNFSLFLVKTTSHDSTLCEMSLSIRSLDFIELIKRSHLYPQIKIAPSSFMRIVCVRNINELLSLADISFVVTKLTSGVKKIVLANDLDCVGINQKVFFVEYDTHANARQAIKIFNSRLDSLRILTPNLRNKISTPVEATWVPPSIDFYDEVLLNTNCFFFENLSSLTTDVMKFKKFLELFLEENKDKSKINKIRQYGNKILVIFDQRPTCLLPFVKSTTERLTFEGKIIPIIPAMKPIVNIGKYRERVLKVSGQLLSEEEKRGVFSIYDMSSNEANLRKKAEMAYNRILLEEKREREREREKFLEREMERERNLHRDKLRDSSMTKGKQSIPLKTDENHNGKYLNKKVDRKQQEESYDSNDKRRKRRERSKDRDKDQNETNDRKRTDVDTKLMSSILNLGQQGNNLSQIASLLPLLNLSGGNNNLQNVVTGLLNLQNMIKNPSVLELVQQLSSINTNTNNTNTNSNQTQINPSLPSSTSTNVSNTTYPSNLSQGNFSYNQTKPSANQQPGQINPVPPSQINPMYTMPKSNQMDMNQNFYQMHTASGLPNPNLKQPGYFNSPYNTYNVNEMYMHPGMYMGGQDYQGQPSDMNLNMNMDQLKNYYDYLQSLNK